MHGTHITPTGELQERTQCAELRVAAANCVAPVDPMIIPPLTAAVIAAASLDRGFLDGGGSQHEHKADYTHRARAFALAPDPRGRCGEIAGGLISYRFISTPRGGMAQWRERLFGAMARNAGGAAAYFNLPTNRVIELGTQVEI